MPKQKSSATSTTRKKHARKAAGPIAEAPPQRGQKKTGKKGDKKGEPRVKAYIPPVKPQPIAPDPLDALGLAYALPAELVVILRRLGKKDAVTKRRALEELKTYVESGIAEQDDYAVRAMLPVWLHHAPLLLLHPSKRIRLLAATLHATILPLLAEEAPPHVLGAWCMTAHDPDKHVASVASTSSSLHTEVSTVDLLPFLCRALLDSNGLWTALNPTVRVAGEEKDAEEAEEGEGETDRNARLRIGALGALARILDVSLPAPDPEQADVELEEHQAEDPLTDLLSSPAFWSALNPGPDPEALGFAQPPVRRAAWAVVATLVRRWKNPEFKKEKDAILPTLSRVALRSAWIESDVGVWRALRDPLLVFLRAYPEAWALADSAPTQSQDQEGDDDHDQDDDENDDGQDQEHDSDNQAEGPKPPTSAYASFLAFLPRPPAPGATYPALVVLLSTLPPSLLTPSATSAEGGFFDALWAGLGGGFGAGSGLAGFGGEMLVKAILECLVFVVRGAVRTAAGAPDDAAGQEGAAEKEAEAGSLVHAQFERVLSEFFEGRLRLSATALGRELTGALGALGRIEGGLASAAWTPLSAALVTPATLNSQSPAVLDILRVIPDGGAKASVVRSVGIWALSADAGVDTLVGVLAAFGPELMQDSDFVERLDNLSTRPEAISSPAFVCAYLFERGNEGLCVALWRRVLLSLADAPERLPAFVALHGLAGYLTPTSELDGVLEAMLKHVLEGLDDKKMVVLKQLLAEPAHFLSPECALSARTHLAERFVRDVDGALRDPDVDISNSAGFGAVVGLLVAIFPVFEEVEVQSVLPSVFGLAFLLQDENEEDMHGIGVVFEAKRMWGACVGHAPEAVFVRVKTMAKEMLVDVRASPSPERILACLTQDPGFEVDLIRDILPTRAELDNMLVALPSESIDSSLGVLDPLLAYPSSRPQLTPPMYDAHGFSAYARVVYAVLRAFTGDRQLARKNLWALRHLLTFAIYADDAIQVSSEVSPVFGTVAPAELVEIVNSVQQVATYLFGLATDDGFHLRVITSISDGKTEGSDGLDAFLVEVVEKSKIEEGARGCRVLFRVLHHFFVNASKDDADAWFTLARKLEKTAPRTFITIISAITQFAPEPSRLDRYRNELAADLFGVPASKANTVGLHTLRKLAAVAPDPESDVVFLPQQRTINVMKTCQQWVTSDEDIEEEVESEMTLIFLHFAPLLQNVPGAHWDLVFDVIENNLESCSLSDNTTLVTLARTLRLIIAIEDLAATNKALRTDWHVRRISALTLVRNLIEENTNVATTSTPRSTCRELVLYILQDLPSSLIDQTTLAKMCHLITDTSAEAQKMAYVLLQEAAKKRTEYLVIESGVDTEDVIQAELPIELVDLLQRSLSFEDEERVDSALFGYMLGWMVTFDLFTDASMKVRSDYVNQLRNLDLIAMRFIPSIFTSLNLYDGAKKAFKLDPWAVDEYYIEHYEPGMSLSLQLLASHLFYRALLTVPSLVRKWLHDCTDRQLSSAVVAYTSLNFSPVIIRTELLEVKSPAATDDLADENMTIKVAQAVNEVTASYLVDEHQLEMTLKMPSDWPLHTVEIKDLKKVGVLEDRWRAWVLGVQQIIWSQNGRIVDGLRHFKKNVALHFEGQVECAICYSIISVMDGSLPRKPCRTCKNRFHAACLYKWLNTSHSSTCPLCRSDIM